MKFSLKTEQPVDCIEWHPTLKNIFCYGTYDLVTDLKGIQIKNGELNVVRLNCSVNGITSFKPMNKFSKMGILDMKWNNNGYSLILATSDGLGIITYNIREQDDVEQKFDVVNSHFFETSLCLCIDLQNESLFNENCWFSLANGNTGLYNLNTQMIISQFKAHEYESWSISKSRLNPYVSFTSGDDCKINIFDIRSNNYAVNDLNKYSKTHKVGICRTINMFDHIYLLSGDFEGKLALWDIRNSNFPICLRSLEGPLWRFSIFNESQNESSIAIALSTTNKHFATVNIGKNNITLHKEYNLDSIEQSSMTYGISWNSYSKTIATCSFYDKKIRLWDIYWNIEYINN